MSKLSARKKRDWLIVFLYILFIYLSLPFMPELWGRLVEKIGNSADNFAALILLVAGIAILLYLIFQKKSLTCFIWLIPIAIAYVVGLSSLKLAIERIHFIEYGLLSFLVFRALRHSVNTKSIYLYSAIIVFFVGLIDEGLQYLIPNRVYDTRDVVVNAIAGILGLCVVSLCIRPSIQETADESKHNR